MGRIVMGASAMRGDGLTSDIPLLQRTHQCPSATELSAFSRGALPLAAIQSIAAHLSACPACDSKVSTFVSDLAHRRTAVQRDPGDDAGQAGGSAQLDLDEARIDASAGIPPPRDEEGPTAPLRLGQYRLVRQIGRGGMGVVYLARHEKLHRDVAIKFVPIETVHDFFDVERLRREMAATGTMRHPNVVYATDAGECEGVQYLVMEYVEGLDLSKLLSRVGPLPVADACEIIRQAAEGLAHVQQQQLVHRDLKPSNLMLAADGTVKILDLGLARAPIDPSDDHELTRNGYLLGTIDYIAPEQARDAHAVDIRSDIYSLGCTFYKLLTGEAPFAAAAKSVASKILAHELQPPPPLSKLRTDVPPAIEEIFERMLAKDPDERFQSPLELKRALKAHVAGADLSALLARVTGSAPSSRPPLADASRSTTIGESQVGRRSTVVSRRAAPRQTAMAIGAVAVVGLLLAGLWLGGWLPGIASSSSGASRRPAPRVEDILAAPDSGQIDYPFPQGQPGIQGTVTRQGLDGLKLQGEFIQLVRLGYLRDDAKRVSFEIDQSPSWHGQVGFFLGYHQGDSTINDQDVTSQYANVAEFQLLLLHHIVDTTGRPDYFRAERMRALVHPLKFPDPSLSYPEVFVARSQKRIEIPGKDQTLPLLVEFSGTNLNRQIRRIVIGGVELDDLIDPVPNTQLVPRNYEGACGLFSYGSIGGATFHNFDLSHLEKE